MGHIVYVNRIHKLKKKNSMYEYESQTEMVHSLVLLRFIQNVVLSFFFIFFYSVKILNNMNNM